MPPLRLRNREVNTVFDLLGGKENDITLSLGWACCRSDQFAEALISHALPGCTSGIIRSIDLQSGAPADASYGHGGFTDIEIQTQFHHLIIEAKRGWNLPTTDQLKKYTRRFDKMTRSSTLIIMGECTEQYASHRLPQRVDGIPVRYVSWRTVSQIAHECRQKGTHAEKRLLDEICDYLGGLMTMKNVDSNLVYVVSLGSGRPSWCSLSWRDIVTTKNRYFCLFGERGWPKEPPNYIGFRYKGILQRIHHVEGYEITRNGKEIAALIHEIDTRLWDKSNKSASIPHFVFTLGPAIVPYKRIPTGKIWGSGRVWAAIDLLMTSPTISGAREATSLRRKKS